MSEPTAAIAPVPEGSEGESALSVRKARMRDIGPLLELVNGYARLGIMLPISEFELAEGIRDFTVAMSGGRLVGCGALHFYGPATAEVRSLAVVPELKNHGLGRLLVDTLEQEALDHGLRSVFAFTYVPAFFEKLGFVEVDRAELPSKVWKDCLRCPKFQCCDEIAMRKVLLAPEGCHATPVGGEAEPVLLPTVRKYTRAP